MKNSKNFVVVISVLLIVLVAFLPGCKKRGASKGPDETQKPIATPVPTPMPTDTDRYEDEIDEATEMTRTDREAMVELEDINFDYDQYALTFEAREVLARNAIFLKRNMSVMIQIEGHCDERGTAEYNLSLGQKRADSTKAYLVSMGIESRRISTISYGEERPLDSGSNEYAWAKNRRAHFLITAR